jgi:acetyl/propionyl-CoA carboxylase alpha subunit
MIRKVLIANRGEIACRIIRTCQAMGLATVAVYSDADKHSLAVEMADEAVHIGGSAPNESYINASAVLEAAQRTGANAIHPGFGFLAENAPFAYQVAAAGLIFIGPNPSAIEAMGDKRIAKLMLDGVPMIDGYMGDAQDNETLIAEAERIGYPLMVKASAGGGGKGMRLVSAPADLPDALDSARREAQKAFGNPALLIERAILNPRHIEVQIFGDQHGNVVAIGERECSVQRRHQKIVEETPSTALTPELRARMCETAVTIGKKIGYSNAGTVEFLLDSDGNYYFMEMNTRLQVEHPVTEMVYGVDLVRWQIEVARNRTLDELLSETPLEPRGHAIEVRVYAEDPANDFLPVIGKIAYYEAPPYVRTDAGIRTGDEVTPFYDPMLAKVIAHAPTRFEAIRQLDYALSRTKLLGIKNNIGYLRRVLTNAEHLAGLLSTRFVEEHANLLPDPTGVPSVALIAVSVARQNDDAHEMGYWRNLPARPICETFALGDNDRVDVFLRPMRTGYDVTLNGQPYAVEVAQRDGANLTLVINGHRQSVTVASNDGVTWWAHTLQGTFSMVWVSPLPAPQAQDGGAGGSLRAPMTGKVVSVAVEAGQAVEKGALLLIMEAMKMEHRIEAPQNGIVNAVFYKAGDSVQADEVLVDFAPSGA